MKGVVFHGNRQLELMDFPDPSPRSRRCGTGDQGIGNVRE